MESIEALDYALSLLHARQRRIDNQITPDQAARDAQAAKSERNTEAMRTLAALRWVCVDAATR